AVGQAVDEQHRAFDGGEGDHVRVFDLIAQVIVVSLAQIIVRVVAAGDPQQGGVGGLQAVDTGARPLGEFGIGEAPLLRGEVFTSQIGRDAVEQLIPQV